MQRCPSRMVERQTRVRLDGRLLEDRTGNPATSSSLRRDCQTGGDFLQLYWRTEAEGKFVTSFISTGSEGRHGRGLEGKLYRLCLEAVDEDDAMGEVVPLADRGRAGDEGGKKDDENFRRFR